MRKKRRRMTRQAKLFADATSAPELPPGAASEIVSALAELLLGVALAEQDDQKGEDHELEADS